MYSDAERLIYKLPGGDRYADPLAARRRLLVTLGGRDRLNELLDAHEGEDEAAAAVAEEDLVKAARLAFALPPLTPAGGVSDAESLTALKDFIAYLGKASGADATPPTSPPPSGSCRS